MSLDAGRLVRRLERLVAFDTQNPPGAREEECAQWLAAELADLGFAVELDLFDCGRANVVGRLWNGPGPSLAFNTHMDVVPAGDGWTGDPFVLRAEGAHLVGRGACDAKGALAAMLEALSIMAADLSGWSGMLAGIFVADEESSSIGAKRFAATRPALDYVVVGEPSGNVPITAHKGSLRPLVRVHGRTAHSGTPDLGINAIFQAGRLLPHLAAHHADLSHRRHALVGAPSLTVTRAQAGRADNVVPDACDLLLDRRLVPGETQADALAEIEAVLAAARLEGIEVETVELRPTTGGPAETRADHPVIHAAVAAAHRHGVQDATPIGFGGACDFVHFRELGAEGVVLGPGDLAVAHKPNEFVPRAELEAAALIYRDIAAAMLIAP